MRHLRAFLLSLGPLASARTGTCQGCFPRRQVGGDLPPPGEPARCPPPPRSVIKPEKPPALHETPRGLKGVLVSAQCKGRLEHRSPGL